MVYWYSNFVSLCRSPNQSEDDFENFCDNFKLTVDAISATNPFLIAAMGDLIWHWYTGDTTTFEGSKIETITSQFGLQQIINEPTHIQRKSALLITFGDGFGYPLASSPKLPSSDSIC